MPPPLDRLRLPSDSDTFPPPVHESVSGTLLTTIGQELSMGEPSSKRRFAVVDAVPTPTPTPLLVATRTRAEICVLRSTLSAEMACGVCAANVRCLELERVCMRIDLVLSSSIEHTVSFYGDSGVLTPSLFPVGPLNSNQYPILRGVQVFTLPVYCTVYFAIT